MGLKEVQEELKKQIEEAENTENAVENDNESVIKEEKKEEKAEEKQENRDAPRETKEETKEDKPKKTNAEYARERREKLSREQRLADELAAREAALAAANARIAELTTPKETKKDDPEPNREEDPTAYAEWRARQAEKKAEAALEMARQSSEKIQKTEKQQQAESLIQEAQKELINYEAEFKKSAKDYDDVKNYYVNMLAFSIKNLNPRISNDALVTAVNNQIMVRSSQLLNDGYENPVAALYDEIKSMGYRPKEAEEKKPDLDRVAKNRERNAGMAAAGAGSGRNEMTKRYAATELTAAEWAKLPASERERIMRQ